MPHLSAPAPRGTPPRVRLERRLPRHLDRAVAHPGNPNHLEEVVKAVIFIVICAILGVLANILAQANGFH